MPLDNQNSQLLGRSILSVGSRNFGEALHRWLRHACCFDNFTIIGFSGNSPPEVHLTAARESSVFDRIDSHYVNGAYLLDPFFGLFNKGASDGLYRLSDVAPDHFRRNEYFKAYYQRTTLIDELAFFSNPAPARAITVCIGRDATTGQRFSPRDLALARRVAPIVNALVRRHWRNIRSDQPVRSHDVAGQLRLKFAAGTGISLSKRQSETAILILQGHSSLSIGLKLGISPQTVKVFRRQLYRKCNISSQGELYYLVAPYLKSR